MCVSHEKQKPASRTTCASQKPQFVEGLLVFQCAAFFRSIEENLQLFAVENPVNVCHKRSWQGSYQLKGQLTLSLPLTERSQLSFYCTGTTISQASEPIILRRLISA